MSEQMNKELYKVWKKQGSKQINVKIYKYLLKIQLSNIYTDKLINKSIDK